MLRLIIGNKAYSSWSMRGWLAVHHAKMDVEDVLIPMYQPTSSAAMHSYSPTGKVPCLMEGAIAIWDSLAICEYVAEQKPEAGLLPDDRLARAVCRSASAEMHSGFMALRKNMPMNVRKSLPGKGWPDDAEGRAEVEKDIRRIEDLWTMCRTDYGAGGPYLFGRFSIADCMFAPVASRFHTYHVELNPLSRAYVQTMMEHPLIKEWIEGANAEPWVADQVEK